MDAPITANVILNIFGIIAGVVAGVGGIAVIVKWITDNHDRMQKYENYEKEIDRIEKRIEGVESDSNAKLQEIRTEQYVMVESLYGVLDGLHQLKCNGEVTKAHKNLATYLNKVGHGIDSEGAI